MDLAACLKPFAVTSVCDAAKGKTEKFRTSLCSYEMMIRSRNCADSQEGNMQIWLGVKDFAKIEEAKVCLGDYVLFVGQNNSGKTFLMQLIQGVLEKLPDLIDKRCLKTLLSEEKDAYSLYVISNENISQLTDRLNKKLRTEKEKLVKEIFQKNIPIGDLYIDLRLKADSAYKIFVVEPKKDYKKYIDEIIEPVTFAGVLESMLSTEVEKICVLDYVDLKNNKLRTISMSSAFSSSLSDVGSAALRGPMRDIMRSNSLFFPASRTGLLLLYRDFFLNKADRTISYKIGSGQALEKSQDHGGLTKPVYEFLRFLQGFSENESFKEAFKDELQFFEDNVINGHISADEQRTFLYKSKDNGTEVPMYLASSMINEVAPIAMALSGGNYYDRLIIDEVESSIHPEKQFELVRFFNRLVRKRRKLIISTHSDSFVSKMNNLYIFSHHNQRLCQEILDIRNNMGLKTNCKNSFDYLDYIDEFDAEGHEKLAKELKAMQQLRTKLGLTSQDLIDPGSVLVYEFVLQDNGKSIVKEVPGDEKRGFQFDLFASSALKLYDEALEIGELLG